jgi:hypothetical protein
LPEKGGDDKGKEGQKGREILAGLSAAEPPDAVERCRKSAKGPGRDPKLGFENTPSWDKRLVSSAFFPLFSRLSPRFREMLPSIP